MLTISTGTLSMNAAPARQPTAIPAPPAVTSPSRIVRPEIQPASGLPRPMPRATVPTTAEVFNSSHRGLCDSPSMYTEARMNATTNVKKAMPTIATLSPGLRHISFRAGTIGP